MNDLEEIYWPNDREPKEYWGILPTVHLPDVPEVFPTPDPPKQIGTQPTDWSRAIETTEHRRLREFVLYLTVVKGAG